MVRSHFRPFTIRAGVLLLAAVTLASPATAQNRAARSGPPAPSIVAEPAALLIAACDTDGDARVAAADVNACLARGFVADPAQNGSVGYIGYADWALKWLGDRNALPSPFTVDTNNDDRITLAELQTQFGAVFSRLDVDKDGVLTRAELLTIRASTGGDEGRRRGKRR